MVTHAAGPKTKESLWRDILCAKCGHDLDTSQIDFIGIGAPKCGTTWLSAQLAAHPQIGFAPDKEVYYFALAAGTVLTVINNTSHAPIAGAFTNLADGATITVGGNTFQANYKGGDGNDLTLTVVP